MCRFNLFFSPPCQTNELAQNEELAQTAFNCDLVYTTSICLQICQQLILTLTLMGLYLDNLHPGIYYPCQPSSQEYEEKLEPS